jgi:hypothetical protein
VICVGVTPASDDPFPAAPLQSLVSEAGLKLKPLEVGAGATVVVVPAVWLAALFCPPGAAAAPPPVPTVGAVDPAAVVVVVLEPDVVPDAWAFPPVALLA